MRISKRQLLAWGASAGFAAALPARRLGAQSDLANITGGATPIGVDERKARVAKAQRLLRDQGLAALILEPGSALVYFTGVRWWRSERFTGAVIPRDGDFALVTPYFEEPSVRESMTFGEDVRTWNEHEDPFALVAGILADRKLKDGRIGIEGTVRYFIADGLRKAAPRFDVVSGEPVTRACRMVKSPAEIALMQAANDVTMAALRHVHARVEPGMSPKEIAAMTNDTTVTLGGAPEFAVVLLNEASAYPHGSRQSQTVREGGVILMDCGCSVHDYQSDISRTWVVGESTHKQRAVWDTVKRGQELALETAKLSAAAGHVDDVVRAYYESLGYGPGYRTPGLSHRLGHGIGIDGHEPVNLVHDETTPLAPGMCFSDEPGIYLPGEFGVRLEDCFHMTSAGPRLFTELSPSLERPFG